MDLIPVEFRQAQWAKSFVRRLARTVLFIGALCAAMWLLLVKLIDAKELEIVLLLEQDGSSQQQKITLDELRKRKQHVQQQLDALSALRGGERVVGLFTALDGAYQPGVWLNRLALHAPAAAKPSANAPKPSTSPVQPSAGSAGGGPIAELSGHAVDHRSLASFMTALGQQPGVTRVELNDTRTTTVDAAEVVAFSLAVQIADTGPPS